MNFISEYLITNIWKADSMLVGIIYVYTFTFFEFN